MERYFIENPQMLVLIALWTLPWKGYAMWKAARLNDRWWFLAVFLINLFGLLEILYIFLFSKRASLQKTSATPKPQA